MGMRRGDITIHQTSYTDEYGHYVECFGLKGEMKPGIAYAFLEPLKAYNTFAQALDAFSDDRPHIRTVHVPGTLPLSEATRQYRRRQDDYVIEVIKEAEKRGMMDIFFRGARQRIRFKRLNDEVVCVGVCIGEYASRFYNVLDFEEKIIDGRREVLAVARIE